ncbi:phytanoyl-CoA dioxygenase family protein [Streptomyces sp. NPDC046465]|uniref:phytanoyl-CoA dioxygenase family protein n=1 Tax=Streptomyces sp. NPDC046465 TaxID=3155810 RepID=UPI0033EDF6E5
MTATGFDLDWAKFRRNGFLELGPRLGESDRLAVLEHFDKLDAADRIPPGYQAQYDESGGTRRLRKLRRLLWSDKKLYAPILHRMGALDLAETLIGPSAVAILHAAFLKPARIGTHVAPHQDQALWDRHLPGSFNMWTALTDVSPANGGLHGYPGSHVHGVIEHRDDPDHPWHETLSYKVPELAPRHDFLLKPGESAMWESTFVHGSEPNTSDEDRRGMVVVFADSSAANFNERDVMTLEQIRTLAAAEATTESG